MHEIHHFHFSPKPADPQSFASLLNHSTSTRSLSLGRATHALLLKSLSRIPSFLFTHLINFYSKLDRPTTAFAALRVHPSPCVVSWTSLISGCSLNNQSFLALKFFVSMLSGSVRPNDFTLPSVFQAAGVVPCYNFGKQIHGFSLKTGLLPRDSFVSCAAMDMYYKTGFKSDGYKLFDEMPNRNGVSWNAVITNYVQDGRLQDAINGFLELLKSGEKPNSVSLCAFLNACASFVYLRLGSQLHGFITRFGLESSVLVGNTLVDFYGKCHEATYAKKVFDEMPIKNSVSWSTIIAALTQNGYEEEALNIYIQSQREGFEPSDYMISSILTACTDLSRLDLGRSIHSISIKSRVDSNIYVSSTLVHMYGKCGIISDAQQMFNEMPERNLFSYNAILGAYSHYGDAPRTLFIFNSMLRNPDIVPNYVTLVSVLTACSRAGLTKLGLGFFQTMKEKWGIEPRVEHYTCIVDSLGRAGKVEQAYEMIKGMNIKPSVSIWGALLGACRMHGNLELGENAATKLYEIDPRDLGNRILVSNMFASAGRWVEATEARKEMKKDSGYSWISWKNKIHVFQAKDKSHPMSAQIQETLSRLRREMEMVGYKPDTRLCLFDLEEEEKESEVLQHSEKLALAFGLICIPNGIPIRISKNLRVCGDCHNAIKFVSGIFGREIIVRDNNRFHRFSDFECSCGDYW